MGLTGENELSIRRALDAKLSNIDEIGYIIPSPISFNDKSDFFATVDASVNTQKEIETSGVAFCLFDLIKREDSPPEGCGDEPLVRLTYNFYFFRQYDLERVDQSETPDEFLKRNLISYNTFIGTIFSAFNEFQGIQNLTSDELPENFDVKTNRFMQDDYIVGRGKCRYFPRVSGHSVDLESVTQILINEAYG